MTAVADNAARIGARRQGSWLVTARTYIALTKPRIIELLLVTTLPAMILAQGALPDLGLMAAVMIGGTLAAASANSLNCYFDRDIDAVMRRTVHRPLAAHTVPPRNALVFGVLLGVVSLALLAVTTNALATSLTAFAILFYVGAYTMGLKRRTPANIVWGGAAGCMPVLIGWSAVTGGLSAAAMAMFLVVFLWTPPHFWALAIRFREDYAAAGVPMLPVVATPQVVASRIVAYSWAMVAASLLLWVSGPTGWLYLGSAVVLGALFLAEAHRLSRDVDAGRPLHPMRLFHWSITYLALLFAALAADVLLLG